MEHYVYVLTDPRKPGIYNYDAYEFRYEPFYFGKGKDSRFKRHLNPSRLLIEGNKWKANKIKLIQEKGFDLLEYVVFIRENISSEESCKLEKEVINLIGRFVRKSDLPYKDWEMTDEGFEIYTDERTEYYTFEDIEELMNE